MLLQSLIAHRRICERWQVRPEHPAQRKGSITVFFFLTVFNFAIAVLDSIIARVAVILRDRAQSDLAASGNSVANNVFAKLMHGVLILAIFGALASTAFATFGIGLTVSSSRAANSHDAFALFGFIQFFVSIGYVALGGFIADSIHGYKSSFARFCRPGEIPYYEIMYYGGVGEAAFGSLMMVLLVLNLFTPPKLTRRRPVTFEEGVNVA